MRVLSAVIIMINVVRHGVFSFLGIREDVVPPAVRDDADLAAPFPRPLVAGISRFPGIQIREYLANVLPDKEQTKTYRGIHSGSLSAVAYSVVERASREVCACGPRARALARTQRRDARSMECRHDEGLREELAEDDADDSDDRGLAALREAGEPPPFAALAYPPLRFHGAVHIGAPPRAEARLGLQSVLGGGAASAAAPQSWADRLRRDRSDSGSEMG